MPVENYQTGRTVSGPDAAGSARAFEERVNQRAKAMHLRNVKVMTPITLSAVAAVLLYLTFVFYGLKPPDAPYDFKLVVKTVLCFLALGGPNTLIFELWVRGQSLTAARVLAWDGDQSRMPQREVISALLTLLDLPHRFIIRFLIQWLIGAPLIVLALKLFLVDLPWINVLFISSGVASLMALMATFHYFRIKQVYTAYLHEALSKFPAFFERPELGRRRIRYQDKVLIYILVLVGSMTFITAQLSLAGQVRASAMQRESTVKQIMQSDKFRFLADTVKPHAHDIEFTENLSANLMIINAYLPIELVGQTGAHAKEGIGSKGGSTFYLINLEDYDLLRAPGSIFDPIHLKLIQMIPRTVEPPPGWLSGSYWSKAGRALLTKGYWKKFFSREVIMRITDNVMIAFAGDKQYTITFFPVRRGAEDEAAAYLYHLQAEEDLAGGLLNQMGGPILGMFVLALILSWGFAHFMQREIMMPLNLMIDSSRKIESGDLSAPDPIMADDELGEAAVHHLRMVASVRAMVKQLGDAARGVEQAASEIAERTDEMARGSEAQHVGVEETSASITEMNQAINNIADSVDTLASSAEQSSASILQMSATNDEVAQNSEGLSSAVEETTSSTQEMSASIREVADNVSAAAGKTSEAAASMREMRQVVKEIDRTAAESAGLSGEVARNAEHGATSVQSTIAGILKIKEGSRAAAEVIERLSKRAREIGRILTVIEDVTEETNLLALNAAIIAAQAGEHGRGFAVVADEIKDLAERTQASTAEIAEQILSVQKEAREAVAVVEKSEISVEEGVKLAEGADQALKQIQESAKTSLEMAKEISNSTMEQSVKADQILAFFESIAAMIEQIKTATYEQSRGSEQVHQVSERMRDIAVHVRKATREQALGGRQISQAIEHISHIANYINTSQAEQKKAAQHVLGSMTRIADIAQQNVLGVEKVTASVQNLKVLADELQAMIESFQMDKNGEGKF